MLLETLIKTAYDFNIEYKKNLTNQFVKIKLITTLKEINKIDKEKAQELATEFNVFIN